MTTIDLELAKELQSVCKEKNIEIPESAHRWVYIGTKWYLYTGQEFLETQIRNSDVELIAINAYTLDELLGILSLYPPYEVDLSYQHTDGNGVVCKDWTAWFEIHGIDYCESDPNPANAACKLLIHLIKEGLL